MVDVAIRAIKPSARRHGVSEDRIREAIAACPQVLLVLGHPGGAVDLVLFLGRDRHGVLLEVVGREHEDGTVTVFHAMRMRPAYRVLHAHMSGLP